MTPAQVAHIMALVKRFGEIHQTAADPDRKEWWRLWNTIEAALRDAPQAEGWVMVPADVLKAASESLGSFVSDHGWGDADMQAMDNLDAYLAAAPSAPTAVEPDERAGWEVIKLGQRPAACDGATSWSCCDTGRCEHDNDNARADASWREYDAARASKGTK